ncbi:hypothetical protein D1872_223370 [compost metagenome]
MADTIVAANTANQYPFMTKKMMITMETKLNTSPQIIIRFGCQRSASTPPTIEKIKIGKYSTTVNAETATGLPLVCSMTKNSTAMFLIQIPIFCRISEAVTIRNVRLDNNPFM